MNFKREMTTYLGTYNGKLMGPELAAEIAEAFSRILTAPVIAEVPGVREAIAEYDREKAERAEGAKVCEAAGHDPNPNDWGYGGGSHVDVWCRRCKGKIQVPADEWPEAKAMWADAQGEAKP